MATKIQKTRTTKKPRTKKTVKTASPVLVKTVAVRTTAKKSAPRVARAVRSTSRTKRVRVSKKTVRPLTMEAAVAPVTPSLNIPTSKEYKRHHLAVIGEYYFMAILFALLVLALAYWCVAMAQLFNVL